MRADACNCNWMSHAFGLQVNSWHDLQLADILQLELTVNADFKTVLDARGGRNVVQLLLTSGQAVVRIRALALSLVISVGACSSEHAAPLSQHGESGVLSACES